MLVPFTEVVLITIIDHYTEDDEDKDPNNTLDNTGEGMTKEDIEDVEISTGSNKAPGPAWLSRRTSLVCLSEEGSNTETMKKTLQDSWSHSENSAKKENTRGTSWTKERKLQIYKEIGRTDLSCFCHFFACF